MTAYSADELRKLADWFAGTPREYHAEHLRVTADLLERLQASLDATIELSDMRENHLRVAEDKLERIRALESVEMTTRDSVGRTYQVRCYGAHAIQAILDSAPAKENDA